MASINLHLIFLIYFLPFSAIAQQTNGSIPAGSSLTATEDIKPWLSGSGEFAFGFQQVQGQDSFLLSIWYDKISDKTIIWYPEEGHTVLKGSKVELTAARGLVLTDPQGIELWTSEPINSDSVAYGVMNDTGNFALVRADSFKLWESFSFPSDTILPGQVMERGLVIYSKTSQANFSRGRFQFRLLPEGNLVLNTRDIASDLAYDAYYASDTYDASNSSNSGDQLVFDATGYMYILRKNGQRFDLTPRNTLPTGDYYHRATLDFDGVFTQSYRPKNSDGNTSWSVIWSEPENICVDIRSGGSGACGFNNVCSLDENRHPKCVCPQGYSLFDPSDPYGDCKPNFPPSCDEDGLNPRGDLFDFVELIGTDWPTSDYAHMKPTSEQSCRNSCLSDCFCAVAIYRIGEGECWKKKLPLSYGRKDTSRKAFLKFRKAGLPPPSGQKFPGEKKDQKGLIIILGSTLLGSSLLVILILIAVICRGCLVSQRNPGNQTPVSKTNLLHFTYQELAEATKGFKDELGKGGFGIVYKGVIGTVPVAVKKLDRVVQEGEKEFKAEVNAIARTHHKNLVQLLGFCKEGQHRLLVYEYMSNGTLADFLFGNIRPTWEQRSRMALGIAKGIAYLHEECTTHIIHCDVKPQNILLDEYYTPRISDFGLAKLLMMHESRTSTGIRGTKGYVAPEWFRNTPITTKVDVYSFGVLLLEIVSCRKSLKRFESGNEDVAILSDWAWDCYQEGRVGEFVENDLEALGDGEKLGRFMRVGLWCLQEDPSVRPSMRMVTLMLEGVVQVTEPPCPTPFSA